MNPVLSNSVVEEYSLEHSLLLVWGYIFPREANPWNTLPPTMGHLVGFSLNPEAHRWWNTTLRLARCSAKFLLSSIHLNEFS